MSKYWSIVHFLQENLIPVFVAKEYGHNFSFDHTNYENLAPLHFNDCLKSRTKFLLYQKFMEEIFVHNSDDKYHVQFQWIRHYKSRKINLLRFKVGLLESGRRKEQ